MSWWGTSLIEQFNDVKPGLGIIAFAAWCLWIVVSICLHELAHGWAALRCGDQTPRELGHMTLNPIKHMGWTSLIVFLVLGFAWGAMPIRPGRFRNGLDHAFVAVAGPALNAILAAACLIVTVIADLVLHDRTSPVFIVPFLGLWLNILLAVFNMLPLPPLDGSKVVAGFVPALREVVYRPQSVMVGIIGLVFINRVLGIRFMDLSLDASVQLVDWGGLIFKGR